MIHHIQLQEEVNAFNVHNLNIFLNSFFDIFLIFFKNYFLDKFGYHVEHA